jgi:hypothetical protein
MVKSVRSEPLLTLGQKLVHELGLDERVDTLSRWMSQWIAELIHAAETSTGDERTNRMAECGAAIMKLWAHRNILPDGKRPFESLEPVLRALESLDPEAQSNRYFSPPSEAARSGAETPSDSWLSRANAVDEAARSLVRYCLTKAADLAVVGKEEWIALAKSVMADDDADVRVIIRLLSDMDSSEAEDAEAEIRSAVAQRIRSLEALISSAQLVIVELRDSIAK